MKRKIISVIAGTALILNLAPFALAETATTLYVATSGSDSAAGTVDAPLATMEGARSKVLELKASGVNVSEVIFAAGDYYQSKVEFTEEDSGTNGVITYKAQDGAEVNFKGSKKLDNTTIRKATAELDGELFQRAHDKAKNNLYVIDLLANGLEKSDICDPVDINTIYSLTSRGEYNQLVVNGVAAMIAQWPNGDQYATYLAGVAVEEEGYENEDGGYCKKAIRYSGDNPDRWVNAEKWWIMGFPTYNFSRYRTSTVSVDPENNIIKFPATIAQEYEGQGARRWKAFNLIEELDLPGEYYIDRDNMKLYIYPDCDLSLANIELSIESSSIVSVTGASDITFEGLTFSQSCGSGVTTQNVNNVDFINCSFENIGTRGLGIMGGTSVVTGADYWQSALVTNDAAYNVDVRGCDFERIGGEAMVIRGGNVDTLTDSGNIIEDNHITLANLCYLSNGCSVLISGCGNTFRNNNIHRADYQAVMITGNNHIIEGNEIYDVMRSTGDGAAIYQGRNQLYRGTEITRNYIHDVVQSQGITTGACGIYMDDGQHGNIITQNIVVNVGNGYNSNYGMSMNVTGNTFVNCNKPWAIHSEPGSHRGTWTNDICYMNLSTMESTTTGELFTTENITEQIKNPEIYFKEYPDLKEWIEEGIHPYYQTEMTGNLAVGSRFPQIRSELAKSISTWSATEGLDNDNRLFTATSEFVDAKNHDYRLRSDMYLACTMPGLLNDKNCDINEIGLKTKRTLNEETAPYRIIYPAVGATFNPDEDELFWQEAKGANRYELEISTDSKFNIIVYKKTLSSNITKISDYEFTDGRTYYWRVKATNISKDMGATWFDSDATGSFVAEVN